ncbi:MAG: rhomboid family intramembrane serine protease [Hyphomicrobiales bacterium]|nr:MAG: rhomboid family intramembrane serine protease [Hyphomicrobiales bacterium]
MFIPLRDANPLQHIKHPYVNWAIIALTVLVYALFQAPTGFQGEAVLPTAYGVIPAVLFETRALPANLDRLPADWTLVTYALFHGDWMHLLGNMVFLWVFGDNIEDAVGHIKYFFFYVICAAGGGYLHAFFNPDSIVPLIGASGAVAGIIAAYLMLHPRVKIWVLVLWRIPLKLSAMWVLGAWILMQIYSLLTTTNSEVAWWAHIGGLLTGAFMIILLKRSSVRLFDRDLSPMSQQN